MLIETFLFLAFLYLIYVYFNKTPEGFPPGEWGWPLIGHLPSTNVPVHDYVTKFRKKYGKTFTWRIGTRPLVFMTDYKVIKEAFGGPNVADRPMALSLDLYSEFKKLGISNGIGSAWHNVRRFSVRHLKDLGMGRTYLEDAINVEVENVLEDFKKHTNEPTIVPYSLNVANLNVIWKIVADVRFDVDDPRIQNLERLLTAIFMDAQGNNVLFFDFFHHVNYWVPNWIKKRIGLQNAFDRARQLREFLQKSIDEHKQTFDPSSPRDFIDQFLIELEKINDGKLNNATKTFTEKELLYTLSDLFAAGSETVSSTIRWMLLLMAEYPEVQKKVQDEIDAIVPRDKLPSLQDRKWLPYTDAVINEVMRFKTIVPFGLYHYTSNDVVVDSYKIPKGTVVVACAGYAHSDPVYWQDPEKFLPERFILDDGSVTSNKEGFLPFSVGQRVCPGESLSRMELFLFCSAFLHRFTFNSIGKKDHLKSASENPLFCLPTVLQLVIVERDTT